MNVCNAPAGKMKFYFCIQSIILIASLQNYNSKNIENNAEIMTYVLKKSLWSSTETRDEFCSLSKGHSEPAFLAPTFEI